VTDAYQALEEVGWVPECLIRAAIEFTLEDV
jgi:hypothetical protein